TEGSGAVAGLRRGAVAIECSTLTPAWVSSLAAQVEARGAAFLDAPVVGSRPQAEAGKLVHLIGGAGDAVAQARPVLVAWRVSMAPRGATPAGATAKLLVNALLSMQVVAIGELLGLARRAGLDERVFVDMMGVLPVMSAAARAAAASIVALRFEPMFPIALV